MQLRQELDKYNAGTLNDFEYWDAVASVREAYRAATKLEFSGDKDSVSKAHIVEVFEAFAEQMKRVLRRL